MEAGRHQDTAVISSVLFFFNLRLESINFACLFQHGGPQEYGAAITMTEQNRKYKTKGDRQAPSEIWPGQEAGGTGGIPPPAPVLSESFLSISLEDMVEVM